MDANKRVFKKRFHLNKWYHVCYLILLIFVSWNQVSYLSFVNWMFACIFAWMMGYKFLNEAQMKGLRIALSIHLVGVALTVIIFMWIALHVRNLSAEEDEQMKAFFVNKLDYQFSRTFFGYTSTFAFLVEQILSYLVLSVVLLISIINMNPPENEQEIQVEQLEQEDKEEDEKEEQKEEDEAEPYEFSLLQQKVSYERQQIILGRIMVLIGIFLFINDGIGGFGLMLCLLLWLAIYYHAIDNVQRFDYFKTLSRAIVVLSTISLYSLILAELNYIQDNHRTKILILTGTLTVYRSFKILSVIFFLVIMVFGIRARHYLEIVQREKVVQIERMLESSEGVSSFSIFLGENYFGVIFVLSVFWISKQLSILRGLVFLLLLVGMIKRDRFKARKKWQTAKAILYVGSVQLVLLLFYNVPIIFKNNVYNRIFHFVGLYEMPEFDESQRYAIYHYFVGRVDQIGLDLGYILVLSWLIYGQQTLDDKRHQLIIDELVHQKATARRENNKNSQWDKVREKLAEVLSEVKKSFLIHFDKLVILLSLMVALNQADVFRGTFLVFFILYAFVDLHDRKTLMRAHLLISFIILFILYTLGLVFVDHTDQLHAYLSNLGMNDYHNSSLEHEFHFVYQFYDLLLGVALLQFQLHVIYKTETLRKYKKLILDYHEYLDDENPQQQQQHLLATYNGLDYFKKNFIKHGLLITQVVLLVVAFIPPANLLSLAYIIFFQTFLYLYYLHGHTQPVAKILIQYWMIIIVLSILILLFRYVYTIQFIHYFIQFIFEQPTLLTDIGLDPNFNLLKLVGNGIVLQLLTSYRRLYKSKLNEQFIQYSNLVYQNERYNLLDHRKWSYSLYSFELRISVIFIYHLQKFVFIFAFFIAVYQMSYLGLVFASLIFLILFKEKNNNWTQISIPFLVILLLQIIIQYTFQATLFKKYLQGQETIQWIGIYDQYSFQYWELLVLLHLCEILPLVYSLSRYMVRPILRKYHIDYTDREVQNLVQMHTVITRLHGAYVAQKQALESVVVNEDDEEEQGNQGMEQVQPEVEMEMEVVEELVEYWEGRPVVEQYKEYLNIHPVYKTLKWHHRVDSLFTQVGLEVSLFIIVISAYYQRNFFSVFYLIIASLFANVQYKSGIHNLQVAWLLLAFLMMFEVLRKYTILLWTPISWDIRKPWLFYSYSCNEHGKSSFNEDDPSDAISDFMKCQADWNYWLSLQGYKQIDIWINFFSFLITLCFHRHFTTIQRRHDHPENQNQTVTDNRYSLTSQQELIQDRKDFTYAENRRSIGDYLKFFIFCYFYKLALIVFLLIGMSSDISSYTEIISCLYFFIAINLLYLSSRLERQKDKIWDKLILFNTVVMIAMSLYQAPFVKCPVIYEDNRYYYDNSECVQIQKENHYYNADFFIFLQDEFQLLQNQSEHKYQDVSKSEVFYMFFSHILGLNKTLSFRLGFSKETLMALFFLLGLLQRNIWMHPYTRKYVDPYFQRQQQNQQVAALKLVEGIHLRKIWKFKYAQAQKDCHVSMQARVSKRVQDWDEDLFRFDTNFKKKSFFYSKEIQNEIYQKNEGVKLIKFKEKEESSEQEDNELPQIDSQQFIEMQKKDEDKIIQAERLVQSTKAPVIQLNSACAALKLAQGDSQLLQFILEEIMLIEERNVLKEIYVNDAIGLHDYYDDIMQEMDRLVADAKERKEEKLRQMQKKDDQELDEEAKQMHPQPHNISRISDDVFPQQDVSNIQQQSHANLLQSRQQPISSSSSEIIDQPHQQPPPEKLTSVILSDQDRKSETDKSLWVKFKFWLKDVLVYLLTQDTYLRESLIRKQQIDKLKLSVLIFLFIAHYFVVVVVIMMIANCCYNANLLALFLPISAFLYGLIDFKTKTYWNFLIIYMIVVISVKFLYQMPIFCDTPPYTFIGFSAEEVCEARLPTITERITRIDYIIGVRKYNENETFMNKILIELLLFITLLIQRFLLQTQGIWAHLKVGHDEYFIPQFRQKKKKVDKEEEKQVERQQDEEENSQENEYDDFSEKVKDENVNLDDKREQTLMSQLSSFYETAKNQTILFYFRVFPTFLGIRCNRKIWTRVKEQNQQSQFIYTIQDDEREKENESDSRPPEKEGWRLKEKDDVVLPEQIKTGRDLYTPQFIITLILLVYFLLFYPNIISKRSYAHITQGQSQRFSSEVIFVILIVITIIVVDRMLFIIRKVTKNPNEVNPEREREQSSDFSKYTLFCKSAMHVVLIVVVHYYFFFTIPRKTNRPFQESAYLILAYLMICFYFYVSALQIHYGYPVSEINQIFTQSAKKINATAFQIYRAIPFLFELRIIIDWTFTTTALDLIQWFKLEDIYATLYMCKAYMSNRITDHTLGYKRRSSEKCCSGFLFALFLIFILLLPILIFSSLNPAVELNNVTSGSMIIKASFIGLENKLFFTLFQSNDLELLEIPNDQFKKIQKVYGEIESSWQERMQKIRVKRFSDLEWNLPENYRDQIRSMIKSQDYTVLIECEWAFQKQSIPSHNSFEKGRPLRRVQELLGGEEGDRERQFHAQLREDPGSEVAGHAV